MAKKKEPKSLELAGAYVSGAELRVLEDRLFKAASRALRYAEMWVRPGAAEGDERYAMRLARKNLERARASYIVAGRVRGMVWHEFERRYNAARFAVEHYEGRIVTLNDAMHPDGKCRCAGEGKCEWCRRVGGDPTEGSV